MSLECTTQASFNNLHFRYGQVMIFFHYSSLRQSSLNIRHSGYGQVISRELDRFECVEKTDAGKCRQFGIGFPCWICYFDRTRFVCCCHIVWPFMPLLDDWDGKKCISALHRIITADTFIGYVHQCVPALPGVVLQSKKLNLFRYCMLRLRPFLLLQPPYQVLKNLRTASNAQAAITPEPELFCWLG